MECTQFSDRLDALLDGTLPAGEETRAEAHAAACPRCHELYALMRVDLETPSVKTPGGLTESILMHTSGRACPRAQTLLGDHVDGTIAGGLALMGLGVVLLANTRFGVSLDWIEEWWPAAPILLGAYLLEKAIQERTSGAPSADAGTESQTTYGSDTDSSPLV